MTTLTPGNVAEARAIQERLRHEVRVTPLTVDIRHIAGVDAAYTEDAVVGVACLYTYPSLQLVESAWGEERLRFPYVPGFLSFREGPALVSALMKLRGRPDLILVDGQGIAHPRGVGIASHLGVILGLPTIGCAKSVLVGTFEPPAREKGSWSLIHHRGEAVGAAVLTRQGVKPLFVSPGHLTDIATSVEIVLRSVTRFRTPEPLRCADRLSRHLTRTF